MISLQDRQHRRVKYLRVSVTDRCNLRCLYCMPEKMEFLPRSELLNFEEIQQLVEIFVSMGISKVRITGGEPLARRDIVRLVEMLAGIQGLEDLAMTTNGVLLAPLAQELKSAGLTRLNVSCDTFNPEAFAKVTRWGELAPVLEGLQAARDAGFDSIKINAVLLRGVNDMDAGNMIRYCGEQGYLLRFIEFMPIGIDEYWSPERFMKVDEMKLLVENQGFKIEPLSNEMPVGGGPAQYCQMTPPEGGTPVAVGFIGALSHNFCRMCNRVRLTSDGRVRECLTAGGQLSLRDMLRSGASGTDIESAIHQALYGKIDGHGFDLADGGLKTRVSMSALGG